MKILIKDGELEDFSGKVRLDKFLTEKLSDLTRSGVQNLIKEGLVLVNGGKTKTGFMVGVGDAIEIKKEVPVEKNQNFSISRKLEILFEDKNVIVINKPAQIAVYPGEGRKKEITIVDLITDKLKSFPKSDVRPGIVHRLDKDTSGVLIIAKNEKAREFLMNEFKNRKVEKTYLALVKGVPVPACGKIVAPIIRHHTERQKMMIARDIRAKEAISIYKILETFDFHQEKFSLLEVRILTGRTHQIRVHMAAVKHPVVGDRTYGNKKVNRLFTEQFGLNRQFLHSWKIVCKNISSAKKISVIAEKPKILEEILEKLRSAKN